jgi:very-short-patch-repair endonuclease
MRPKRSLASAARDLRQWQTSAEDVLWFYLRNRRLGGLKFRRQHPIGPFIADFCCYERRLIVELDGSVHDLTIEQDIERSHYLNARSFEVIRFRNAEVFEDLGNVLRRIEEAAGSKMG